MAEAGDAELLKVISRRSRAENGHAARKVMTAAVLWDRCVERDVQLGNGDICDCRNTAAAEIAVRLGCSTTMTQGYAEVGMDLRLRLPRVQEAFVAGELDYARVAKISRLTSGLHPDTVERIEAEVLACARLLSPGPLATEIEQIIMRASPEEAAARRRFEERFRRVRVRPVGTAALLEATLSPEEAQQAQQLIAEVADTVCAQDRRGRGTRMADALLALLHGEDRLACSCRRDECPKTGRSGLPSRRTPLTQITIDVATLLGLVSNPAYLAGHGPIVPQRGAPPPDLARRLAEDSVWQVLLTEARELARQAGWEIVVDGDDHAVHTDSADDAETEIADVDADTADIGEVTTAVAEPTPGHSAAPAFPAPTPPPPPPPSAPAARFCVQRFLARGRRHRAGFVPLGPEPGQFDDPHLCTGAVIGTGLVTERIMAALAADPTRSRAEFPDGHGGWDSPPPGALTYRPSAEEAALVRARDRHCRFPGCRVPAARCQLDHRVPFRHRAPITGGWTIQANLQCLCAFHHRLKTMGLWWSIGLTGDVVQWTGTTGTTAISLPAAAYITPLDATLVPYVPCRREPKPPEEPLEPPEPPPF